MFLDGQLLNQTKNCWLLLGFFIETGPVNLGIFSELKYFGWLDKLADNIIGDLMRFYLAVEWKKWCIDKSDAIPQDAE